MSFIIKLIFILILTILNYAKILNNYVYILFTSFKRIKQK